MLVVDEEVDVEEVDEVEVVDVLDVEVELVCAPVGGAGPTTTSPQRSAAAYRQRRGRFLTSSVWPGSE